MRLTIKGEGLTGAGYRFELDGVELTHVKSLELSVDAQEVNVATIRFMVDEVDVDAAALAHLQAVIDAAPSDGIADHVSVRN